MRQSQYIELTDSFDQFVQNFGMQEALGKDEIYRNLVSYLGTLLNVDEIFPEGNCPMCNQKLQPEFTEDELTDDGSR